jgi:alpha-N-arabinofuranosidase
MAVKLENDDTSPVGLSLSASRQDDQLVVTLVNPKHDTGMNVNCAVMGKRVSPDSARMLHHQDFNACNTFESPDTVVPQELQASVNGSNLRVELPPLSIVTVSVRLS